MNKVKMISCKEVLANLSDYIDEEGSTELRRTIEDHLSWCRRCRVAFDTTEKALKIVLDVEPFDVPLAVSARLYARIERVLSEG